MLGCKNIDTNIITFVYQEIEYLAALNRWAEVNLKYKEILEENPDQWVYYGGYFDSVKQLKQINYTPSQGK